MVLISLTLISLLSLNLNGVAALWPQPRQLTTGTTALKLSPSFDVQLSGISSAPKDLQDAIQTLKSQLAKDKLAMLTVDRGASFKSAVGSAKTLSKLTVSLSSSGSATATGKKPAGISSISEEAVLPLEQRQEGYTLSVPVDGSAAKLEANSTLGLYRGLTTFGQLWFDLDGTTYLTNGPVQIQDSPLYKYRGFMLDTARNYFPVSDIKRTLDAMSWVKLNTFHWHVVDSQSFPLVVPGFEDLSQKAAYSPQMVYSESDVKGIVAYAAARGIDVVAEIDTPGHTSAISKAHPEHIACAEASPWSQFANEPPAGQLRLASPATTNFTANLIKAAASMFSSQHFSTGGDELNQNCYTQDAQTQQELTQQGKTLEQALDTFTQATHKSLADIGKVPVVWEEMVLDHNVTLSNETVVMVWISSANVAAVAAKGFKIVHAASDYFYLDCGGGGWVGDNTAGNSWCDPFKTWQLSYNFDPLANLTSDEASLILGGQHLLWTEQSHPSNLDPIVWPRAASGAELFWSGPGAAGGIPRNNSEALVRLHELGYRLNNRGVGAIALQPLWCAVRPGACDLNA